MLDVKAAARNERRNVPRHVTALEQPVRNRLRPLLPALDARIGRASVFKKDELPAWPQDTSNTSNGLHDAGDRAQGESTDSRIDGAVLQRDALARQVQELNFKVRLTPVFFRKANHARIGFQCIDPAHSYGIVVNEINAWANANLEDIPFSQGDESLSNLLNRLGITKGAYEPGINVFVIE